jgi:hypothetical protein
MQPLHVALERVLFAASQTFRNLSVTPLVSLQEAAPDYDTLDEAMARGDVVITETSEAGEVPEILLANRGERAVLLLDGQELIGAKQNRMLNLTILAPAMTTLRLPVSCVERGRWSRASPRFGVADRTIYAAGRGRKARDVTDALRRSGARHAHQGAVWEDIRAKMDRMGSRSATEAMAGIYDDNAIQIDAYVEALPLVPNQIGAVFAVDGEIRGVELFDFAATCRRFYPQLMRSYALDALEGQRDAPPSLAPDPRPLIAAVKEAETSAHRALGEGEDLRLSAEGLTGGALIARERL